MAHLTLNLLAASSASSVVPSTKEPSDRTMSGQPSDNVLRGINLAFFAITMLPIAFVTFVSFYRVRSDRDPARTAFTYMKVMLPLALLALLVYTISGALALIATGVDWYIFFRVSIHMNLLGGLFFHLVDLLLVVTLVEVGNGFLFCLTESRTVLQRVMRYAAIASCAILAVIAVVAFGIITASVALFSSPGSNWTDFEDLWKAGEKLFAAFIILLFVWAAILMGFSTHVYNKAKRSRVLGNSSVLFLYAAILNLLTRLYLLIYVSLFFLAHVKIYIPSKTWTALSIVGPILTAWIYAAIVAIIVTIAVRKHNGIWTTVQSWTDEERRPLLATDSNATGVDEHLPEASSGAVTT